VVITGTHGLETYELLLFSYCKKSREHIQEGWLVHEVGQKTIFGFVVYGAEEQNRLDRWEDYVFLNRRKDGRYSLKAYKWAESFKRANKMVWISIDSEIGFRGAQRFDQAISRRFCRIGQ
jgi:hypothetical protein